VNKVRGPGAQASFIKTMLISREQAYFDKYNVIIRLNIRLNNNKKKYEIIFVLKKNICLKKIIFV
jgi:hypothetical protein